MIIRNSKELLKNISRIEKSIENTKEDQSTQDTNCDQKECSIIKQAA